MRSPQGAGSQGYLENVHGLPAQGNSSCFAPGMTSLCSTIPLALKTSNLLTTSNGRFSHCTENKFQGQNLNLPACLWGCWRLRWLWGLFPCCKKRAAPFTMKKLSLKLGRIKPEHSQAGIQRQCIRGKALVQTNDTYNAHRTKQRLKSFCATLFHILATSLLLERLGHELRPRLRRPRFLQGWEPPPIGYRERISLHHVF